MMRGTDPEQYRFKWGQRAKLEMPKMNILNFVCEVYGGNGVCKPKDWLPQYKDACKEDLFNEGVAQQMADMTVAHDQNTMDAGTQSRTTRMTQRQPTQSATQRR